MRAKNRHVRLAVSIWDVVVIFRIGGEFPPTTRAPTSFRMGRTVLKGDKMRKPAFLLLCCVLWLPQLGSAAQSSDPDTKVSSEALPPFILAGLNAYKDKGPEEAVRTWIKGSPIDGSKDALSQANILRQIQDYYGAYQGFEVARSRELSPRARIVFLILDFDKGPLFAKFDIYRTEPGWILTSFTFNTKAEAVLPSVP